MAFGDPGRERAATTQTDVSAIQAKLATPQGQQLYAQFQSSPGNVFSPAKKSALHALESFIGPVPKGWWVEDGTLKKEGNTALKAGLLMAGVAGGAFLLPALASGGAAGGAGGGGTAAAGGGTAAGTTAAATGLPAAAAGVPASLAGPGAIAGGSTLGAPAAVTGLGASGGSSILSRLGKSAPAIGKVATGIASGRAEGRTLEANQQQSAARDEQAVYQDARREALLAALMGPNGVKDTVVTPPEGVNMGTITGGLKPSALSGSGDLAALLAAHSKKRLENPPDTNYDELGGKPNALDKILSTIGTGASLYGATMQPNRPLTAPEAPLPDAQRVAPLTVDDLLGRRPKVPGYMSGVRF